MLEKYVILDAQKEIKSFKFTSNKLSFKKHKTQI